MAKSKTTRRADALRPVVIRRGFTAFAPGSVLMEMGRTQVLCTASVIEGLPAWREPSGLGWVTAEYSMLPSATPQRKARARTGHTDSRGTEIQRFIGRALRAVVDFRALGPITIQVDCDVLQADGGTRTAAVTGAYVAVADAVGQARKAGLISGEPLKSKLAAVSVGKVGERLTLDLDYEQDSRAEVDFNVAMTDEGRFVELQATAEGGPFTEAEMQGMLKLARRGIEQLLALQARVLDGKKVVRQA